jgi:hypothetical protein
VANSLCFVDIRLFVTQSQISQISLVFADSSCRPRNHNSSPPFFVVVATVVVSYINPPTATMASSSPSIPPDIQEVIDRHEKRAQELEEKILEFQLLASKYRKSARVIAESFLVGSTIEESDATIVSGLSYATT